MRRPHRYFSSPDLSALDQLGRFKPRYLLHGVIAAVGVATLTSIALQPRHTAALAADTATLVDSAPPMLALDLPAPTPEPAVGVPAVLWNLMYAGAAPRLKACTLYN